MLSIVFPAYNEEGNVTELHRRILSGVKDLGEPFEIIAVENASTDGTYKELCNLRPIRIVRMAYNIGQTAGLDAGIHAAKGDIIVTMDADLQNDPSDIGKMLTKLHEGYDAVVGWRVDRHDTFGRRLFSRFANFLTRNILGFHLHDYACALKMFKKKFLIGIHLYGEMHVFLGAILHLRGARVVEMPVKHHERIQGLSKHNFIKGSKDFADLLTIKFLFSTSRPLLFFGTVGLGSFALGGIASIWAVVLKLIDLRNFAETPLPVVASLFVILGVLSVMMGFLAELLVRIYYESQGGTPYQIAEIRENT